MSRPKKVLTTKRISIVVTTQVYKILAQVTADGYSGKSVTETAEEMIRRGLEHASEGDSLLAAAIRKRSK